MSHEVKEKMILIYSGSPVDAIMVNQLLNESGIYTHVKNEIMGTLAPWQVTPGGMDPVEIFILSKDEAHAQSVISAFNASQ